MRGKCLEAEAWQVVRGILADEFAIASQDSSRTWEQGEKLQAVQDLQCAARGQLLDDEKITPGGAAILHQQPRLRQCLVILRTLNERSCRKQHGLRSGQFRASKKDANGSW